MKTLGGKEVSLFIPSNVFYEMITYAKLHKPKEICGWGELELKDGNYAVKKVFIAPQETSRTSAEQTEEGWNELRGKLTEAHRFQWHSHVEMNVYQSLDDQKTEESIMNTFQDYLISAIVNVKGEIKAFLTVNFNGMVLKDELNVLVYHPDVDASMIQSEIDRCCKEKEFEFVSMATYKGGQGKPYNYEDYEKKDEGECLWCEDSESYLEYDTDAEAWFCPSCRKEYKEIHAERAKLENRYNKGKKKKRERGRRKQEHGFF